MAFGNIIIWLDTVICTELQKLLTALRWGMSAEVEVILE